MRKLAAHIFLMMMLAMSPAFARGGSESVSPIAGPTFSDVRGFTVIQNYGWNDQQIVNVNRAVYQGLNQPSRYANCCVAWQIRTGDNPLGKGNDRNEVLQMFGGGEHDETPGTGPLYYALSVYIPSGWADVGGADPFFIILQLHGPDTNVGHSAQANFQFLLDSSLNTPNHYTLRTVGGPITGNGSVPAQDDVITDLGPLVFDQWEDWVFVINWASDVEGTGQVTVYKRTAGSGAFGAAVATVSTPTLYSVGGVTQTINYFKHGIYRNSDSTQGTETIYFSPLTRAPNFQAAATASFGSYP